MKINVTSHKHHYIPQFYLQNFCRTDGTFEVYDKKYSKFKKSPQSPATVLFEKNRNTIKRHGVKTDVLEKNYSQLEALFAQLFKLINLSNDSSTLLNKDSISLLKKYLAIQLWRLPVLDEFAERFILNLTLEETEHYCQVTTPPLNHYEAFELIKKDVDYRYYFRCFMLPLCTFSLNNELPDSIKWDIVTISDPSVWSNFLCSDVPIIFKNPEKLFNFSGSFIFPLSNTKLLISKPNSDAKLSYDPILSTKIAIYIYLQANRYVIATNKSFLEKIIEFSKFYEGAEGFIKLQNEIFEFIE